MDPGARPLRDTVAALLATLLVCYLLRALDHAVLQRLTVAMGDTPGVLAISMYRYFAPVAAFTAIGVFVLHRWWVNPRWIGPVLIAIVVLYVGLGVVDRVRTLTTPTYDGQRIRETLMQVTAADASIGGDWAPILTLGTGRPTLYVDDVFNPAPRFPLLRLDYFLSAGSWQDDRNLRALQEMPGLSLGEPLPLGTMLEHTILLYPLRYDEVLR